MNCLLTRASSLLTLTSTILSIAMFLCFLSTAFDKPMSDVKLGVTRVAVDKAVDYTLSNRVKNDLGLLRIDLESSLDHLFNWNVKQLFIYLTAEYKTAQNEVNEVVLWDKIILRGSKANLQFQGMNTKYYFWDDGFGLLGNSNVTLRLSWNSIPNVGMLSFLGAKGSHTFVFPSNYAKNI